MGNLFRFGFFIATIALLTTQWKSDPPPEIEELEITPVKKKPLRHKLRRPASAGEVEHFSITTSERPPAAEPEPEFINEQGPESVDTVPSRGYQPMEFPLRYPSSNHNHVSENRAAPKAKAPDGNIRYFSNQGFSANRSAAGPAATSTDQTSSSSGGSSEKNSPPPLNCSASVGAGSYSSPRMVTLSCSAAADIKYCVQEGACCDPNDGAAYSGSFLLGPTAGDFCLSFQGQHREISLSSNVQQLNYSFNPDVPHFIVTPSRRHWQTGQLSARMSLQSNNFGSPDVETGILNLLSHDPTPAGLNLSCAQIVQTYSTLVTPAPMVVMPATSVAGFNPAQQVNAWLTAGHLSYGTNNLTTYLVNHNYAVDNYACTTTQLVLEDFDYFTAEAPESVSDQSTDTFLLGGVTALGPFSQDTSLNRTPAGSMVDTQQGQELRTGLLGLFF